MMDLQLRMTDVYVWTGTRELRRQVSPESTVGVDLVNPAPARLSWPAAISFFDLCVLPPDGNLLDAILPETVDPEGGSGRIRTVRLTVSPGELIELLIRVDTDAPEFRRQAEQASGRGQRLVVPVVLALAHHSGGEMRSGRIDVLIEPAARMPVLDGYVGIDLGNVSSTVAFLGRGWPSEANVAAIGALDTVPSVVQIRDYHPPVSDRVLDTADFRVGSPALAADGAGAEDGVVFGPKRLLTARSEGAPLRIRGRDWTVDKALPVELLIAGLLHEVHRRLCRVPRQIAITCPTTFSAWEAHRLRQALLQGWRRSLGATKRTPPREVTDLPALLLDEASAAALYLFVRDYLTAPGGLTGFRYLYPDGAHMLVFDCGGGSIDMALIRAAVDAADSALVRITVLGRTGLRDFGGDAITAAVARVLKTKLLSALCTRLGEGWPKLPPYPPTHAPPSAVRDYVARHAEEIERLLPTRFDSFRSDPENLAARARALTLWDLAERVKRQLAGAARAELVLPPDDLDPLLRQLTRPHTVSAVKGLSIALREVDAFIGDRLLQAVGAANGLVRSRLGGRDLDRAYLIGNGSLYPAVQRVVLDRLRLPFARKRLHLPGGTDRKEAVAKGAALALALQTEMAGLRVEFDGGSMDRLPYDIGYADFTIGNIRILYREGSLYTALQPTLIPVPGGSSNVRVVTLSRRWPGDEAFTPFLSFQLSGPVAGPLELHLDSSGGGRHGFRITDASTGQTAEGVETEAANLAVDTRSL